MPVLILLYSFTGNNRVLAQALASRIDAEIDEIRSLRRRTQVSILLDMVFRRQPRIAPLTKDPGAFASVLLIAPLWDMAVAYPMAQAIRQCADRLETYDFVTFCGYDRPGQSAHVTAELTALVGHPPRHQAELHVADLVASEDRNRISKVTPRRVAPFELDRFEAQIAPIVGWYRG